MSIDESLQRAVLDQRLHYLPMDDSDPIERSILLHEEVRAALLDGTTEAQRVRMMKLRADMESFVSGGAISMCFIPREADEEFFGLLDPPGEAAWDMRSRDPPPGLRVLGMFAKVNTFVALDWWPRSVKPAWTGKQPLTCELRWRMAIHEVRERWHHILPGEIPVSGTDVRNYVTGIVNVRN
jgi:hypothetical protein